MRRQFPDRSKIWFGREPDIDFLLERSEHNGVTCVIGRAQMGKSWLLTELARRLSNRPHRVSPSPIIFQRLLAPESYLVGFAESLGETADLLLRSVVDLYSRWLSDSNYWEQAQVLYQQQKKDLIGRAGEVVGSLFEKLSKLGAKPGEAVGALVKQTFETLASANRELLSRGIQLPHLQIEQGRDLLHIVHKIANRRLILIFDQWEKSPGLEMEANVLDSFLRHLDDWPPCHIFLGVRTDEKPLRAVQALQKGFPGKAKVYDLPLMHLNDSESRIRLLQYVRNKFQRRPNSRIESCWESSQDIPEP
jgi:hypothetical protein